MDLTEIRSKIDKIDDELASLYSQRMALIDEVIEAKKQSGKAVNDPDRENKILFRVSEKIAEDKQVYLKRVFETIFETSKAYQTANTSFSSKVGSEIRKTLEKGQSKFPVKARVACQGVAGAYSGIAAQRLFEIADITYFKNFDGVFQAVEKGLCKYGLLPIENSTAGSVYQTYDLLATLFLQIMHFL